MSQQPVIQSISKEARMILAIQALQKDPTLGVRKVADIYNVSKTTLKRRRDGTTARRDTLSPMRKLTILEEETIVQFIIELCTRAFPPRLSGVEDMANQLLRAACW